MKWGWREIIKNNEKQKKNSLNGSKKRGGGGLGREQGGENQIKEESCGREELWKLWGRFQQENHHHPHALKIRLAEQEEQYLTDPLQRT